MRWRDSSTGYGLISRSLHWAMAGLILWQLVGMACRLALSSSHPLTLTLARNHTQIGTLLFGLILVRLVWALTNRDRRPGHGPGWRGRAVRLGHGGLCALMLAVPSAALLRAWGNESAFAPFGIEVFAARPPGEAVQTAVAIGNTFHAALGWIMAALILGHVAMALHQHFGRQDGTLWRMIRGPRG